MPERYNPEMLPEEESSAFERFACPGCGEEVDVPSETAGKLVRCPYCSTDFFASAEQAHLPVVDDTEPPPSGADVESTFDTLRIKKLTQLRMGDVRARSWWLVGLFFCVLFILAVIWNSVIDLKAHQCGAWFVLRALLIIPTGWFGRHCQHQVKHFQREIEKSMLTDPTTPPDFSTLDNGSQRWKELGNIR